MRSVIGISFHFKNATGFLAAFLLFMCLLNGNAQDSENTVAAFPTEAIVSPSVTEEKISPVEEFASGEGTMVKKMEEQVVVKTKEIINGVVAGDITAAEHALTFDSFLSETFCRIRDSWVLCKHELLLAQEAANEEAKQIQKDLLDKIPEIPASGISLPIPGSD